MSLFITLNTPSTLTHFSLLFHSAPPENVRKPGEVGLIKSIIYCSVAKLGDMYFFENSKASSSITIVVFKIVMPIICGYF